jgi:hypothetical protein
MPKDATPEHRGNLAATQRRILSRPSCHRWAHATQSHGPPSSRRSSRLARPTAYGAQRFRDGSGTTWRS